MARGITENDVWTAADALLLEGARPTIERVRQKIGRGSPNTVSPYLDSWFKNLGGRIKDPGAFSTPADVPDPVVKAAKHLWEMAQAESRRDLDQQLREGMAAAIANVEAEKERAALADAAAFEASAKIARLQADLTDRDLRQHQEALARSAAEARLSDALQRIEQIQKRLALSETAANDARAAAERKAELAFERAAATERRAALMVDAERIARTKAEKRAESLLVKLDVAQDALRTEQVKHAGERAGLQAEIERLQTYARGVEVRELALQQRVDQLATEGMAVRAALAVAEREAHARNKQAVLAEQVISAIESSAGVRALRSVGATKTAKPRAPR